MNPGVRLAGLSAISTIAAVVFVTRTIGGLGATEAMVTADELTAVSFIAPAVQETVPVAQVLSSVRGIDPVACRLVGQALENRWGRGAVAPSWSIPGDGGPDAARAVTVALRGEVAASEQDALLAALASSDDCERRVGAQLVGRLSDEVVGGVVGLLRTGPMRTRVGAALALGYGEWRDALEPLTEALRAPEANLRKSAAWALGRVEHVDAIEPLTAAIRDSDLEVRANAIVALGWIESARAIPPLAGALEDTSPRIRINAAWALGQIESPQAIPALTEALGSDQDPEVRRAAAWALGRIE